jgi:hypothetical protein
LIVRSIPVQLLFIWGRLFLVFWIVFLVRLRLVALGGSFILAIILAVIVVDVITHRRTFGGAISQCLTTRSVRMWLLSPK